MGKNRIHFEEEAESALQQGLEQGQKMYFDETDDLSHSSGLFRFLPWILMVLLILSISFYAWWQYKQNREPERNLLKLPGSSLNDEYRIQTEAGLILPKSSANSLIAQGIHLYHKGKYNNARSKIREGLKLSSKAEESCTGYLYLGAMDYDQAHYSSAIRNFNKAINTNKYLFMAYSNIAKAYRSLGYNQQALKAAAKAKSLKPEDVNANLLMGNLQSDNGNIDEALKSYHKGLKDDPDNVLLLYNMAVSYIKQGKKSDAAEYFQKVILASPNSNLSFKSHSHLGTFYYERAMYEKAKEHYLKALTLNPESPKLFYNLGLIALKENKKDKALDYFKKSLALKSNSIDLYIRLARALKSLAYNNLALNSIDRALEISPLNIKALFLAGSLSYEVGNLPAAERYYRTIIKNSPPNEDKISALNNLGIILDEQNRFSEAEQSYKEALSINSASENTLYNLGLLYKNSGRADKAIQTWKRALQIYPDKGDFRKVIADYYFQKGFYKEAIEQYAKYTYNLKDNPRDREKLAYSFLQMGIILQKEENLEQAESYFHKVIKISRNAKLKQKAHLMLALNYSNSGNLHLDKAKKEAYKAININPANAQAKIVLAKVLLKSPLADERETAIDELRAISSSEESPSVLAEAFQLLGQLYFKNGEYKRAVLAFHNSLDLKPDDEKSYKYLKIAQTKLNNNYQ